MNCRTNGLSDQWTVGPKDCMAIGSLSLLPFILLPFSRYVGPMASVAPMDCRTNGLSHQWTVWLLEVCHCCHSSCCYSVDRPMSDQWTVGPMDCLTNGLSHQWTVWLLEVCHCCHLFCCYSVDMSGQWTVGSMDCRTNGRHFNMLGEGRAKGAT